MKNLPIDLNTFPFFEREKAGRKTVRNRCGRDFLFYALAFYLPSKFGLGKLNAYALEHEGYFGVSVPAYLAWTQIQFLRVPQYFRKLGLQIFISDRRINSFFGFVYANLFSRMSYEKAITSIEKMINGGEVAGVDITIGYGGLLDHVLFVYGYDADNFYVFDTIRAPIGYAPVGGDEHTLKLPKTEVKKRWTRFGRVWRVVKTK